MRGTWLAEEEYPFSISRPRSPLSALAYEWAGIQSLAMLMCDCPEKVEQALALMEAQEQPILDALCELAPPIVHFPDNLSSDNLTSYYDAHMRDRHRRRLDRLHTAAFPTTCSRACRSA